MKKILLFVTILMTSCQIFAQSDVPYAEYTPLIPNRSTTGNNDYYRQNTPQSENAEIKTIRGYYYNENRQDWASMLIKVKVGEGYIKLIATKGAYGWESKDYYAKEVSISDSEFVRENFTYRVWVPSLGMIYF
jgi:hypothetical protein